ncbi:FecCD family ABC transporter permease [Tomitella cavernea]|uniref:FecCD family ABC transporter permease n=1 Tax=Tomitella cavernea TaxID=1387982 RepID=UPI003557247B
MTATTDKPVPPAPGAPAARNPRRRRTVIVLAATAVALVVLAVLAACLGQVPVDPGEVVGSILHRVGIDWFAMPAHPNGDAALWEVRFPRVVLAMLVGASLGCAGAVLQGVFANPLAEPGVIGVSAGAAVGASSVILIGGTFSSGWAIAAAAFAGGLGTTLLVYGLARADGRTEVVTVILTGVAVNAVAGGLIAYFTFVASPAAREQIVFWQLGTLGGADWEAVGVVAPLAVAGVVGSMLLARKLDLLALGEGPARHLGVDVERVRRWAIVIVGVLVAAGVAFTGIIAFVGLVVPHAFRMLIGPSHRMLIPASTIGGAVVLLAADIGARTLVSNADLPLGMLTSLVGGPFFFWLLHRTRRSQGGWS